MKHLLNIKKIAIVFLLLQIGPIVYYFFQTERYSQNVHAYFINSDGGISGLMSMVNQMGFGGASSSDNKGIAVSAFVSSRANVINALKMDGFELLNELRPDLDISLFDNSEISSTMDSILIDTYERSIKNELTSHFNQEDNSMELFFVADSKHFVNRFTDNLLIGAEKFSLAWNDNIDSLNLSRLDTEVNSQTNRLDSLIFKYAKSNDRSQNLLMNIDKVEKTILEMNVRIESEKLMEYIKMREMAYAKTISAGPLWVITRKLDKQKKSLFLVLFIFNLCLLASFTLLIYFGGIRK